MRLIKPSFEILDTNGYDINGIYKDIERAARTCYKSESNITEDSAKKMVDSLIKRGHTSCLEHGTVYLIVGDDSFDKEVLKIIEKYSKNPYSKVTFIGIDDDFIRIDENGKYIYLGDTLSTGVYGNHLYAITTNYRVLVEHNWLDDLKYLCEPTEYHEKRISVRFICSRSISHELVRHRVMSFCQESQRYCNYSADKFNNEITFIIPSWANDLVANNTYDWEIATNYNLRQTEDLSKLSTRFIMSCCYAEAQYLIGLQKGWQPQQAREILPNATKTEIIVTGFASDWKHFFELRCDKAAHPDMRVLAIPLQEEFIKREYI